MKDEDKKKSFPVYLNRHSFYWPYNEPFLT
jgi:hypothetical protein